MEDEVLEAVRMCVEPGTDVNPANCRNETALHGAAFRGVNRMVEYLVEQGADLDARTVEGWTPLAIANGLSYSDFFKAQVHTADLLRELMTAGDVHRGTRRRPAGLSRLLSDASRPGTRRRRA